MSHLPRRHAEMQRLIEVCEELVRGESMPIGDRRSTALNIVLANGTKAAIITAPARKRLRSLRG